MREVAKLIRRGVLGGGAGVDARRVGRGGCAQWVDLEWVADSCEDVIDVLPLPKVLAVAHVEWLAAD
jgi:hypothetical protein